MRTASIAALALLAASCNTASDPAVAPPATEASPTTSSTTTTTTLPASTLTLPAEATVTTTTTTTTTAPTPQGLAIEVDVRGSDVTGGGRVRVPLGETVRLLVTADVADEVHVHGYDLYLDLEPGVVGELVFEADVPGVFEIELEGPGLLLVDLEVGG